MRYGCDRYYKGNKFFVGMRLDIVVMDKRGRLTLPAETREKLESNRFLVVFDEDSVHLISIPEPEEVKGSIQIPWSIKELEEAGEKFVGERIER